MADDFERQRRRMVETQIAGRGVTNARVLQGMREVPRELFVEPAMIGSAYRDSALPIRAGQTISQPLIVAEMIAAARLGPESRVLEVGAGSGYAAAVLARVAGRVYAIERHAELVEVARERLAALGCANVDLRTGDGTLGWPEAAPLDAIVVSAGGPVVPATLKAQLATGGRLVMPVGEPGHQRLLVLTRVGENRFEEEDLGLVAFVPLVGAEGWPSG